MNDVLKEKFDCDTSSVINEYLWAFDRHEEIKFVFQSFKRIMCYCNQPIDATCLSWCRFNYIHEYDKCGGIYRYLLFPDEHPKNQLYHTSINDDQ